MRRNEYMCGRKKKNRFLNLQFYLPLCFFQMSTQIVFIIIHSLEGNTACAAIKLVQQIINVRPVSTVLCAPEETHSGSKA